MGLVRLFLALSVAVWHFGSDSGTSLLMSGYVAVISFFLISGFYMSMVINESYAVGSGCVRRFYVSRALRLYPAYLAILALTFAFWRMTGSSYEQLLNLDLPITPLARAGLLLSNVDIFGLDAVAIAAPHYAHSLVMRLVGPAWSLAIELQFYLAAPFIVTQSLKFGLALLAAAAALRLALLGFAYDPWRYYFAPAVWCFFLLGHIAYRLSALIEDRQVKRRLGIACCLALPPLAWWAGVRDTQDLDSLRLWTYYIALAAAVPFLFELTRRSPSDRLIGNLSYPIYLIHPVVYTAFLTWLGHRPVLYAPFGGLFEFGTEWCLIALVCVIAAALALRFAIEVPIDRIRARLRSGAELAPLPAPAALARGPVS